MSHHNNKSTDTVSTSVQTNVSLMTARPVAIQPTTNHPSYSALVVANHTFFNSTQISDKKNHRILSMIFFVLGMLVIFRLIHG